MKDKEWGFGVSQANLEFWFNQLSDNTTGIAWGNVYKVHDTPLIHSNSLINIS